MCVEGVVEHSTLIGTLILTAPSMKGHATLGGRNSLAPSLVEIKLKKLEWYTLKL